MGDPHHAAVLGRLECVHSSLRRIPALPSGLHWLLHDGAVLMWCNSPTQVCGIMSPGVGGPPGHHDEHIPCSRPLVCVAALLPSAPLGNKLPCRQPCQPHFSRAVWAGSWSWRCDLSVVDGPLSIGACGVAVKAGSWLGEYVWHQNWSPGCKQAAWPGGLRWDLTEICSVGQLLLSVLAEPEVSWFHSLW